MPVASGSRVDSDGTQWATAELALAPLAPSDYVLDVGAGDAEPALIGAVDEAIALLAVDIADQDGDGVGHPAGKDGASLPGEFGQRWVGQIGRAHV